MTCFCPPEKRAMVLLAPLVPRPTGYDRWVVCGEARCRMADTPLCDMPEDEVRALCVDLGNAGHVTTATRLADAFDATRPKPAAGYTPPPPPSTNPKDAIGVTKAPLHAIPPLSLLHLGRAMEDGRRKYGLMNWREHDVAASVYYAAAMRHLLAWWDGEDTAADSGVHHLAHVMACCAIILDATGTGSVIDDRPEHKGAAPRFMANPSLLGKKEVVE